MEGDREGPPGSGSAPDDQVLIWRFCLELSGRVCIPRFARLLRLHPSFSSLPFGPVASVLLLLLISCLPFLSFFRSSVLPFPSAGIKRGGGNIMCTMLYPCVPVPLCTPLCSCVCECACISNPGLPSGGFCPPDLLLFKCVVTPKGGDLKRGEESERGNHGTEDSGGWFRCFSEPCFRRLWVRGNELFWTYLLLRPCRERQPILCDDANTVPR